MQKEETTRAVVIADTYNNVFSPITKTRPMALFPLVGVPLIDIALDSLALAGVQETILFTCNFVSTLKEHISEAIKNKAVWSITMDVQLVTSDTCHTMGDAMRELYAKGLIRGYFILTDVNTISNVPLLPLLEQHKQLCKKDKNVAMTLVYKKAAWGHQLTAADSAVILVTDGNTGKILSHKKIKHADLKLNKNISVPVEIMLSHPEVVFHHNLVDTNIAVCSPNVLPLFADNFDFQSKDDFVKGILMNEEILESTLYWTTLKGKEYAANISNWQSYQTISRDILHHWVFPLTINNLTPLKQQRYLLYGDHILKNKNVTLGRNCFLEEDVIIREACIIGENTNVTQSFIGDNCQIGNNVSISNSHILAGAIIMDNCKISDSFIGEDCVINENCIVTEGTILAPKITLDVNSELRGHVALSKETSDEIRSKTSAENTEWDNESNKSDEEAELIGFSKRIIETDSDYSSSSDEELSTIESPTPDDTNIFLQEVIDSLARGYEEKLNCDYLILEINSSRYAYNMQLGEVNFYVVRAILSLPVLAESAVIATALKDVMRFFLPIFKNYIKSKDSIMESLNAIEESCLKCLWLDGKAGFIIHFLYEHDITDEDSIVDWYESLTMKGSEVGKQPSLIKFIQWLQQASEESEESE